MEKKPCACKKNGRGRNMIKGRITVKSANGEEISNRDLACRHCVYKKRGDTSSCLHFEEKPEKVLAGGECEAFLDAGHGLETKKEHGCGCGC